MKLKPVFYLNVISTLVIGVVIYWTLPKIGRVIQANWWVSYPQPDQEMLAVTPPMGWNGWNYFRCSPELNEQTFKETVDAIVDKGLKEAGYTYVNLDDCWQVGRDEDGFIIADPERFPSGIKALSDYVHARGLKFGIYTSGGRITCEGRPGSYWHEEQDLLTYLDWGVDFIKVDWCGIDYLDTLAQYQIWRDMIKSVGRPMVLSVAIPRIDEMDHNTVRLWGREVSQMWRTARDLLSEWTDILRVFDRTSLYDEYAGPGGWNDADMLQVGNSELSLEENRAHFTLWAMMASPLLIGTDVRHISPEVRDILTNPEVIAIDQDPLGRAANLIRDDGWWEVWSKVLSPPGGQRAVVFLNRDDQPRDISVSWGELGLYQWAWVRDVWNDKDIGWTEHGYTATVPPRGLVLLRVTGLNRRRVEETPRLPHTVTTGDLTDQKVILLPTLPVERPPIIDPFGDTITMEAGTNIRYNLSGRCTTLDVKVKVRRGASDPASNLRFKIYGDGRLLGVQSGLTLMTPEQPLTVDVRGQRVIDLVVEAVEPRSIRYQEGMWIKPHIECQPVKN